MTQPVSENTHPTSAPSQPHHEENGYRSYLLRAGLRFIGNFSNQPETLALHVVAEFQQPTWRRSNLVFHGEWNHGLSFFGTTTQNLTGSQILQQHFPSIRPSAGDSVTGGTAVHTPQSFDEFVLESTLQWKPNDHLSLGVRSTLVLVNRSEDVSTTVQGVSGSRYQEQHVGGNGCIPGDIYCVNGNGNIPSPEAATPRTTNVRGPFQQTGLSTFSPAVRFGGLVSYTSGILQLGADFYLSVGSRKVDTGTDASVDPTIRPYLRLTVPLPGSVQLLGQARTTLHIGPPAYDVIGALGTAF